MILSPILTALPGASPRVFGPPAYLKHLFEGQAGEP